MYCSSDSEDDGFDDGYGNAAKKLEKIRGEYEEVHLDCEELLEELDTEQSLKKDVTTESPAKRTEAAKKVTGRTKRSSTGMNEVEQEATPKRACTETTTITTNKRVTRSKNIQNNPSSNETASSRGRGQRRRGQATSQSRGRGRRGRGRNLRQWLLQDTILNNTSSSNIVTYSIGNTEDYPDQYANQEIFNKKQNEVEDYDYDLDNEELSVKVCWQSIEYFKFTIRKYQKLTQLFDYFSKKFNISKEQLVFFYNDRLIHSNDSPDSIGYNHVKFIEGGIVDNDGVQCEKEKQIECSKEEIKLKFQCQKFKKPFEITTRLDEKLSIAMIKFAEQASLPINKLKFKFDGDLVSGKNTPRELEMEGGECIDVSIKED